MDVSYSDLLVQSLPYLIVAIAWIVALIFSIRIVRRKRETAETLLLIGVCLLLVSSLISVAGALLTPWIGLRFAQGAIDQASYIRLASIVNILRAVLSFGGIVLLAIAFWKKFKPEKAATGKMEDRGDLEL